MKAELLETINDLQASDAIKKALLVIAAELPDEPSAEDRNQSIWDLGVDSYSTGITLVLGAE